MLNNLNQEGILITRGVVQAHSNRQLLLREFLIWPEKTGMCWERQIDTGKERSLFCSKARNGDWTVGIIFMFRQRVFCLSEEIFMQKIPPLFSHLRPTMTMIIISELAKCFSTPLCIFGPISSWIMSLICACWTVSSSQIFFESFGSQQSNLVEG